MKTTHSTLIGYICWVFGFMGLHRFYYGKKISGCIWALTLGLLGIGWLIDVFLIPSMNRETAGKYHDGEIDYNVAFILNIFLGILGIHRFYMGKLGTGLLFLFTGGLFGIGYIYDIITLNDQVDEQNQLKVLVKARV